MNLGTLLVIAVAVIVILGGLAFVRSRIGQFTVTTPSPTPIVEATPTPEASPTPTTTPTTGFYVEPTPTSMPIITYPETGTTSDGKVFSITQDGINPLEITIEQGDSVFWVNEDGVKHQIVSDPHPAHNQHPAFNEVGSFNPGERKSLSFPQKGSYRFHDEFNPQISGIVNVQ